jgi:hypothetical protein
VANEKGTMGVYQWQHKLRGNGTWIDYVTREANVASISKIFGHETPAVKEKILDVTGLAYDDRRNDQIHSTAESMLVREG